MALTSGAKPLAIVGATIVTPELRGVYVGTLTAAGGRIVEVGPEVTAPTAAEILDGRGLHLLPGFIDVHVHGGGGGDAMDATPEALRALLRMHARHGTTGLLATTMTQSREKITKALANARAAYEAGPDFCPDGAQVLGVHLEGPYISPKRPGAQPKEYVRPYDADEFSEWLDASGRAIRLITLAPEQPGGMDLLHRCREEHIVVSLGHTDANAEQTRAAIEAGASHATHLFNAMPGIHHRNPGPIPVFLGGGVKDPESGSERHTAVELICDGFHVAPEVARMVARTHPHLIAITDAMSGAGMGDGMYELGGQPVHVSGGQALLGDGTLAGSVLTMDRAAKNLREWLGLREGWQTLARLTATNAASHMQWDLERGRIAPGLAADLVLVDDEFNVHATIVAGRVVYRR